MTENTVNKQKKVLLRIENNLLPLVDLVAKKRKESRTSIINLALNYWLSKQKKEITKELKECEEVLHYCK